MYMHLWIAIIRRRAPISDFAKIFMKNLVIRGYPLDPPIGIKSLKILYVESTYCMREQYCTTIWVQKFHRSWWSQEWGCACILRLINHTGSSMVPSQWIQESQVNLSKYSCITHSIFQALLTSDRWQSCGLRCILDSCALYMVLLKVWHFWPELTRANKQFRH